MPLFRRNDRRVLPTAVIFTTPGGRRRRRTVTVHALPANKAVAHRLRFVLVLTCRRHTNETATKTIPPRPRASDSIRSQPPTTSTTRQHPSPKTLHVKLCGSERKQHVRSSQPTAGKQSSRDHQALLAALTRHRGRSRQTTRVGRAPKSLRGAPGQRITPCARAHTPQ